MDDRRYSGTFTVKKLTIGDLSKLGARKAQLCGGMNYDPDTGKGVDPGTAILNEMIAHCEIALIETPEWFDSDKLSDVGVLNAVYEEVAAFEANFLRRKPKTERERPTGSDEDSSGAQSAGEGGPTYPTEDVVDRKIPKISPLA
jgi:hypothetical protein